MKKFIFLIILVLSTAVSAESVNQKYTGTARDEKGNLVYIEEHDVQFTEAGDVLRAKTEYKNAQGDIVGIMNSDFAMSLTAPAYVFEDRRNRNTHGIRYINGKAFLFSKDFGKEEKIKEINAAQNTETLLVGCQGLHYYLQKNLAQVRTKKKLPILFLIPGSLDQYNFQLEFVSETPEQVQLKIKISNLILRLFAPSLDLVYDKKNGRLLNYYGISNIADEKGKMLKVRIEYDYPTANLKN